MIIRKKRIRNLGAYLVNTKPGTIVVPAVRELSRLKDILERVGFTSKLADGETVLPAAAFGPASRYNAEGCETVHRDRPKETAFRMREWSWVEYRGRYDRVEKSKIVEVPYQRYPRTFCAPPAVELQIASGRVVAPAQTFSPETENSLLHVINLMLEIFGECELLTEDLEAVIGTPIKRLNWNILPTGCRPWAQLESEIRPLVDAAPPGNQPVIKDRFEKVNSYSPEFVAVGQAGFAGYIVFGFPQRRRFVLESIQTDNATYVFDKDWEALSQLTKAEILNQQLQTDRIIHRSSWHKRLDDVLR